MQYLPCQQRNPAGSLVEVEKFRVFAVQQLWWHQNSCLSFKKDFKKSHIFGGVLYRKSHPSLKSSRLFEFRRSLNLPGCIVGLLCIVHFFFCDFPVKRSACQKPGERWGGGIFFQRSQFHLSKTAVAALKNAASLEGRSLITHLIRPEEVGSKFT